MWSIKSVNKQWGGSNIHFRSLAINYNTTYSISSIYNIWINCPTKRIWILLIHWYRSGIWAIINFLAVIPNMKYIMALSPDSLTILNILPPNQIRIINSPYLYISTNTTRNSQFRISRNLYGLNSWSVRITRCSKSWNYSLRLRRYNNI